MPHCRMQQLPHYSNSIQSELVSSTLQCCSLTAHSVSVQYSFPFHCNTSPFVGMARMCCDGRRTVRQTAITYLQRALLAHELQVLTAGEWLACFQEVRGSGCMRRTGFLNCIRVWLYNVMWWPGRISLLSVFWPPCGFT